MKVVHLDFEIEEVVLIEEDDIVVENKDKVVIIRILRIFSIRILLTLCPIWILSLWGLRLPWHECSPIVLWLCI